MAVYANIVIDQGSDFTSTVEVEDTTGGPADLTNYTAFGQIRKTYKSVTAYSLNATVANASEGKLRLSLTNAETSLLKAGRYVYDVEVTSPSGTVSRVIEGQVEVTPGVSRA